MSFNELERILEFISLYPLSSPLYSSIPLTLNDLILNRKPNTSAEFTHLCLIPCAHNLGFDPKFLTDIYTIKNTLGVYN
jgi:hypothetical protein